MTLVSRRGRRLFLMAIVGILAATSLRTIAPASAHAMNSLHDNWEGVPQWTQDAQFAVPSTDNVHAETSAVFFNNQWQMFHRRLMPGTTPGVNERYLISRSVSSDGTNWTLERDVLWPALLADGCNSIYAPKVLVQPGLLTMVFEANPSGPEAPTCPTRTYQQVIAMATSTDGATWTNPRTIVRAKQTWEGFRSIGHHAGGVGSPTINAVGTTVYIGYDGWDGSRLRRGYATYVGDTRNITAVNASGNNNLSRRTSPMTFYRQDGVTVDNRAQFSTGIGEADIINWQPSSGGTNEGGWYMVFEGFRGPIACGNPGGGIPTGFNTIAIARADSPGGPWKVQDNFLMPEAQGTNPTGQCGRDMPAWQFHDSRYKVILTQPDRSGLQRITLNNSYIAPPPPPPTACNDGVDNDSDGRVDMADPGCSSPSDTDEWNPPANTDRLGPGDQLNPGEQLRSADGRWCLVMQGDGNLVGYQCGTGNFFFHTETDTVGPSIAKLEPDGHFVLYRLSDAYVPWERPHSGWQAWSRLIMQNDRNIVIYTQSDAVTWACNGDPGPQLASTCTTV
jgi:hypothetical protein